MMTQKWLYSGTAVVGLAVLLAIWPVTRPHAQPAQPVTVPIDNDDIGGVVTSKSGPEAGVWVSAETTDLGTRFARSVVTDERGRYVVPDLPKATYNVWVRGYGLVDSPKVKAAPGQTVNLTAVPAPSAAAAAEYYPAIYWFAMLKIPDKSMFPGTGPQGNGKRDAYVEPNQPEDPSKDKRIGRGFYGIAYSPADGSIWGSNIGFPGYVLRLQPGPNPSETALVEIYKVPEPGFGMHGFDIDRQGVAWVTLASGHIASFDRRQCKGPLNGPGAAEGNLCPEGWTFYPIPGPAFAGRDGAAEGPYYTWVDQHDILGLGPDTPIGTGNFSDLLHALTYGKVVELRVPYPMGFFTKGLDGRIDNPQAGWKGRGLWATSGNRAPAHISVLRHATSSGPQPPCPVLPAFAKLSTL